MKTSSDYSFVRLGPEDVEDVVGIEAVSFPTPWTAEQYRALLKRGGCALFGARMGSALAGYVAVALHSASLEMEVYNIAVLQMHRQRGIGGQLLNLALRAACKNGIERVVLEVRETNEPALALYRSRGFVPVGRRPRYYPDTGEDALVLAHTFMEEKTDFHITR